MGRPPAIASLSAFRLRRFLEAGYFPLELPPTFSTRNFGREAFQLSRLWTGQQLRSFRSSPERYSVPRAGRIRRQLEIVNPINQLHVADLISANWDDILARIRRSGTTVYRAQFQVRLNARCLAGVNYDEADRRKIQILAQHGRYIQTDIVRFFPSIRTDTIAWALRGKAWVQANAASRAFQNSYASQLGDAVAAGQGGQAIGIPVGPDTSWILAEVVASELEETAKRGIPDLDTRGVRYADDMFVGVHDDESPEAILAHLASSLYEFELELNNEKTTVHGIGIPQPSEWVHFLRGFSVSASVSRQREDIDSYFKEAMRLADANPRQNVLLFASKNVLNATLDARNLPHLVRWLLYVSRRAPSCLSFVAEHLAALHEAGTLPPSSEVNEFILQQIPLKARAAQTGELSWLLFWARELSLRLDARILEPVCRLRSGVCALLTLDLLERGAVDGDLSTALWESFANVEGLQSEMWLPAYEATKKRWWPRHVSDLFIRAHMYFGELYRRDVEFYEPNRRARIAGGGSRFGSTLPGEYAV